MFKLCSSCVQRRSIACRSQHLHTRPGRWSSTEPHLYVRPRLHNRCETCVARCGFGEAAWAACMLFFCPLSMVVNVCPDTNGMRGKSPHTATPRYGTLAGRQGVVTVSKHWYPQGPARAVGQSPSLRYPRGPTRGCDSLQALVPARASKGCGTEPLVTVPSRADKGL